MSPTGSAARDRDSKLEIMRDSRLGTYGALILMVSFATKLSALLSCRMPSWFNPSSPRMRWRVACCRRWR